MYVDHLVICKAKEAELDEEKEKQWIAKVNSLRTLDGITHLKVSRVHPAASPYTHALHTRFSSVEALASYGLHPEHLKVVKFGNTLFEDVVAVDWNFENNPSTEMDETKAFLLLKLKVGVSPNSVPLGPVSSAGMNFSPRSKGFNFGCLLGSSPEELDISEFCDDYVVVQLM